VRVRHWMFGTQCVQTPEVFERREPVLLVVHDDDGIWQLIGSSDAGSDGSFGHLHHAIDRDPTLADVLDLPADHRATRDRVGGPWGRHPGDPS
jgi:hypothetical protein